VCSQWHSYFIINDLSDALRKLEVKIYCIKITLLNVMFLYLLIGLADRHSVVVFKVGVGSVLYCIG